MISCAWLNSSFADVKRNAESVQGWPRYIRVHQMMKWVMAETMYCRLIVELVYHFQDSSMMGAVMLCVPSKNQIKTGTKGGLEQKLEQVLFN